MLNFQGVLVKMREDVALLDKWYISDSNNVPPVSILQPIDSHLKNFLNKRNPECQAQDAAAWWGVHAKLQGLKFHQKKIMNMFYFEVYSEKQQKLCF